MLTLVVSLVASLGSLYYSEIVGLTPCTLCWYQRILMYPLVILALVGLRKRDAYLPHYALPLSILGILISGYHYALQMFMPASSNPFINCIKGNVSCSVIDVSYFGFVTIPLLSFVAFVMITFAMATSLRVDR